MSIARLLNSDDKIASRYVPAFTPPTPPLTGEVIGDSTGGEIASQYVGTSLYNTIPSTNMGPSATPTPSVTFSLPAGDWLIIGFVSLVSNKNVTACSYYGAQYIVDDANYTYLNDASEGVQINPLSGLYNVGSYSTALRLIRISVNAPTDIGLITNAVYTGPPPTYSATFYSVRMR